MRRQIYAISAFVLILITNRSYSLYLAVLGQSLGFQNVEIGLLTFARMITQVVLLVPAGILIDISTNKYRLLQVSITFIAISSMTAGFVQSFLLHIMLNMLFAAGLVLLYPAMISLITAQAKTASTVSRVSVYSSSFTLGIALGAIIGSLMSTILPLPNVYQLLGGLGFVGILLVEVAARKQSQINKLENKPTPIHQSIRDRLRDEFTLVYRTARGGLQSVYIAEGLRTMAFFGFYGFLSVYVLELGSDITLAGIADSLNSGVSFVAILVLGRYLKPNRARPAFIIGVFCHVVLLAGFFLISAPIHILVLMTFAGVAWAITQIGNLSLLTLQTQDYERGRQNGVLSAAKTLGGAIGSPIVGGLSDITGAFSSSILFSISIASIAAGFSVAKVKAPAVPENGEKETSSA